MKTIYTIVLFIFLFSMPAISQENISERIDKIEQQAEKTEKSVSALKKLKVSGYVQTQFQYGEKDASLKVGSANENKEEAFNRIGVRRGRIKFVYEEGIASGVFQIDLTEKGIAFKDVYLNLKDPWMKSNALRTGIFDRPFGYEISYSSSRRESPERSAVFQALFPQERDLGAMLILQPSAKSALNFISLQAGLFAGNGIKAETDNRKDFIGQLKFAPRLNDNISFGIGASYYNGGVYQGTTDVYTMQGNEFTLSSDASNKGKFAKREYLGFDGQVNIKSILGATKLNAEYLFGQQPGTQTSTNSPNGNLPDYDVYIRNFQGGYVMLVQSIGSLPFSVVVKYDWYDPNTKIAGNALGLNGTGKADMQKNTLGAGAIWDATKQIRLLAYYEFNNREKSENIAEPNGFKSDAFTLRLQYKF